MADTISGLELLQQQNYQLSQLEQLLKDEYDVLQLHDPEKLIDINQLKNVILKQIDETDLVLGNDAQFLEDKSNGLFTQELQDIESILLNCKKLNLVNGEIVHKSQVSIERMRTTLLENHTKSTLTYDKKGKTSGGLSSLGLKA